MAPVKPSPRNIILIVPLYIDEPKVDIANISGLSLPANNDTIRNGAHIYNNISNDLGMDIFKILMKVFNEFEIYQILILLGNIHNYHI